MAVIIPAILETDRDGFDTRIFQAERISGVERIQIDFADGTFTSHKTVPVTEMDVLNPAFHWEGHLMIREPGLAKQEFNFLDYQIAGFKTLIMHYEAFAKEELIDEAANAIKQLGMVPGVAINLETPVSVLRYFGDTITHFLLMSVTPGAQGRPFQPAILERIRELRALLPHATIEIDGGINAGNCRSLIAAGADLLAIGSALFASPDPGQSYTEIENALLTETNI